MSHDYEQIAKDILTKYKAGLSASVAEQITASDDQRFVQLVASAMAGEVDSVVGRVDQLARELRSRMTHPDLGL